MVLKGLSLLLLLGHLSPLRGQSPSKKQPVKPKAPSWTFKSEGEPWQGGQGFMPQTRRLWVQWYLKGERGARTLVSKGFDFNGDQIADMIYFYDETGKIVNKTSYPDFAPP